MWSYMSARSSTAVVPVPMFLSVKDAAALLAVSQDTIWRSISNGVIPAKRLAGRVLIDRQALLDSLEDVPHARMAA